MYLCNDASIRLIADEVRKKAGTSQQIPFVNIADMIRGLVVPVDRGSPSAFVTSANPVYQIQRGKYSGGLVSVVPENVTAVLSKDGGYVEINNAAASVSVPAKNVYSYDSKKITPSDNATSISINGLSFSPTHFVIINTYVGGIYDNAVVSLYCDNGGGIQGLFTARSGYLGSVTSASVSFGNGSVTISNIVGVRNGSTINGIFRNKEYCWFAWG